MKAFDLDNIEQCKEEIREFINELSDEDFMSLRKSALSVWPDYIENKGKPDLESLEEFKTMLSSIDPDLLKDYPENKKHELLIYIFAAVNDRYMT